jgi:hypothetical protein
VKHIATLIRRAAGNLAAVPAVIAMVSLHAEAAIVLMVLIVVGAVCWTITNAERSERLAMLISALRGSANLRSSRPRQSLLPARPDRGRTRSLPECSPKPTPFITREHPSWAPCCLPHIAWRRSE